MSATRPFAKTLSERAALLAVLLAVVAGAVAEEEPDDDGLGLEEEEELELKVPGVGVPEVEIIAELLPDTVTVEDVTVVPEAVVLALATDAAEVGVDDSVMGPGPRLMLNRRLNERIFIVNGPTGNDLRYTLCQ